MTVLDSSAAIDYLLADGVASRVEAILSAEGAVAAPDLLVFEVLAVLRRDANRGVIDPERARGAVADLGDMQVELFGGLALRDRVWELRENLTAGDAQFLALAEMLGEPLATTDRRLAAAARSLGTAEVLDLTDD